MIERTLATTSEAADGGYFAKHEKIRTRIATGRFANLRIAALAATLGVLYLLPWLLWDGRPAFLFDLPNRKFYLAGLVLWPQDLIYLTALLVSLALLLFLITALAGRVWCGYACPQTVFTEVMIWLERLFEGDRSGQLRMAKSTWTPGKLLRKSAKWVSGVVFALWTAVSAVGMFVPIRDLVPRVATLSLGPWEALFIVGFTGAILLFGARMREQVCIYMCPYARFQSAMFDRDTLIVSYDPTRGEPRMARSRGEKAAGAGDCVNCTLCVQVCPTGIDIRDGLQYQCIACTACIDACDSVMDRIGSPRGLIRYTTQNAVDGRPTRVLRPRVFVYAALMATIATIVGLSLANRVPLELDVLRDRNAPFREARGGLIENVYRLKILNMDQRAHAYVLSASGPAGISVDYEPEQLQVEAGKVRDVAVRVRVPPESLSERSTEVSLELTAVDVPAIAVREETRFLGPRPERG